MNHKKKDKITITIFIIILIIFALIKYIPYSMKELGIDDMDIYKKYNNMIELKIDSGVDFAFVLDKNNKIIKSLYLNERSTSLELKQYQNKKIDYAITEVINKLILNKKITDKLYIIEYNNQNLSKNIEILINDILITNNIKVNIIQKNKTLKAKTKEIGVSRKTVKENLIILGIYSANLLKQNNTNESFDLELNKENSIQYSNAVYEKLIKYQSSNNIINEDINNHKVNIENIPVNSDNTFYPDNSSWYYIKDSKVYAYIKFSTGSINYSFCYNGSNRDVKEGECQ